MIMGYGYPLQRLERHLRTVLLFILSAPAMANIVVDRSVIEFEPNGEYFTDISVYNDDTKKAYVSVSVFEITNPGMANEQRQPLADPDQALLLATPTRLVLEPKQESPIRLLNLDEEQSQERIYRVLVEPVSSRTTGNSDGVRLLIGYEMLVIIHPRKPIINILASRSNKTMTFYNAGNTNVYLETGEQCHPTDKQRCSKTAGTRLYAGNYWTTELTYTTPITFTINTGGETTIRKTFDGSDSLPSPNQ